MHFLQKIKHDGIREAVTKKEVKALCGIRRFDANDDIPAGFESLNQAKDVAKRLSRKALDCFLIEVA